MLEVLRGAILLGIGGTLLFVLYYLITTISNSNGPSQLPLVIVFSFVGFVAIGLGFALILQSSKNAPISDS